MGEHPHPRALLTFPLSFFLCWRHAQAREGGLARHVCGVPCSAVERALHTKRLMKREEEKRDERRDGGARRCCDKRAREGDRREHCPAAGAASAMPMPTRGGKHGAEERVVVIERPEKQRASKERAASRPLSTTGADAAASSARGADGPRLCRQRKRKRRRKGKREREKSGERISFSSSLLVSSSNASATLPPQPSAPQRRPRAPHRATLHA